MPQRIGSGTQRAVSRVMCRVVVVAVTNGRLDGRALLTRTSGTWVQIFSGQAEWLARESCGRRWKRVLVKSRTRAVLARCSFGIIGE
jgi:hypothetical protein